MKTQIYFAVLALWVSLSACSSSKGNLNHKKPTTGKEEGALTFKQKIYPFTVLDERGKAYEHPFLGGYNVPRPQFIDIDNDNDQDLFIQEFSNKLIFFENEGTPSQPKFIWKTDHYKDIDIGEWYRFADLDDDGDWDLLSERKFSYIQYFKNIGTPEDANLVLAVDTLKDVNNEYIYAERQNIPNLTDLDCDGHLDFFLGRLTGTITHYESIGMENDVPILDHVTDNFEDIEIIGQQFGSMHGANTMVFGDYDGDGDEDLFWGDFFEAGILLIENTGTCQKPSLRHKPEGFPLDNPVKTSGYNAPVLADLDNDNDLDLYMGVLGGAFNPTLTTIDNLYAFEQQEDGSFVEKTKRFLYAIDTGSESVPTFADLDNDGDQDLIVSNKIQPGSTDSALMYYFENTGTATQPSFELNDTWNFEVAYHYVPTFEDIDADGDLDMLLGTWNDGISLYVNEGSKEMPNFVLKQSEYITLTRGSNSAPALVDIDADGDLDLFIGEASGALNFYRNTGSATQPAFELITDTYQNIDVGRRSFPAFIDVDKDGDWDMVLGTENEGLKLYLNEGTPQTPQFVLSEDWFSEALQNYATPAFVDIDADGDLDLFVGGLGGGVVFFEQQ